MEKHGYGVDAFSEDTFVGVGAVIRNLSPDEDALDVTMSVKVFGPTGELLEEDTDWYEAIPAATTYHAASLVWIEQGYAPVARVDVSVSFRDGVKKAITLPPVSNLRVQEDEFGYAEIAGELENPSTRTMRSAVVTAVAFDAAGNVIGGGFDILLDANVPPAARAGFEAFVVGRRPSEVASAQASVDPSYER